MTSKPEAVSKLRSLPEMKGISESAYGQVYGFLSVVNVSSEEEISSVVKASL